MMTRRGFLAGLLAQAIQTESHLVLAIDVSGSVNEERFKVQREGYAEAIVHPRVIESILMNRGLWLTLFEWSESQDVVVPWTFIAGQREAQAVAQVLVGSPRKSNGSTAVGDAMLFGRHLLLGRQGRLVMDVSGDGRSNFGSPVGEAREQCESSGITVNGLAITDLEPDLEDWYRNNVVTSDGFCTHVADREDLAYALVNKMRLEIAG